MFRLIVVAFAALCLMGTSSLALADDAMKGEMGSMKDETKGKTKEHKGKKKEHKEKKAHKDAAAPAPAAPAPAAPAPPAAP
jgi:Sec-independent protein translocase protein TatA